MGYDLLAASNGKQWNLKGIKNECFHKGKGIHETMIAAISLRHGILGYQFIKGGVGSPLIFNFIYNIIKDYRDFDKNSRITVFLDNVASHLKKEVKIYVKLLNFYKRIIFLK